MGVFGFDSDAGLAEFFGVVDHEDRAGWQKEREGNAAQVRSTAANMANQTVSPALDMAKQGINAQMHGAQMEEQRGSQAKETVEVTERRVRSKAYNVSDSRPSGHSGPDF